MEITQEHKRQIEKIISEMECPKDFECRTSDFENLGKTRLIADNQLVECMKEDTQLCRFTLPFGNITLCKCPLRKYIAQNFHR